MSLDLENVLKASDALLRETTDVLSGGACASSLYRPPLSSSGPFRPESTDTGTQYTDTFVSHNSVQCEVIRVQCVATQVEASTRNAESQVAASCANAAVQCDDTLGWGTIPREVWAERVRDTVVTSLREAMGELDHEHHSRMAALMRRLGEVKDFVLQAAATVSLLQKKLKRAQDFSRDEAAVRHLASLKILPPTAPPPSSHVAQSDTSDEIATLRHELRKLRRQNATLASTCGTKENLYSQPSPPPVSVGYPRDGFVGASRSVRAGGGGPSCGSTTTATPRDDTYPPHPQGSPLVILPPASPDSGFLHPAMPTVRIGSEGATSVHSDVGIDSLLQWTKQLLS